MESNAATATAQNSPEWFRQRVGKLSASKIDRVLSRRRWKVLMRDLAAEIDAGTSDTGVDARSMAWGRTNEKKARNLFEMVTLVDTYDAGFILHPDHDFVGASPDFLTDDDGGELKCPYNPSIHLEYLAGDEVPKIYVPQVQCQMWVTGTDQWWFASFDPRRTAEHQLFIKRVERDQKFINKMEKLCIEFWNEFQNYLIGKEAAAAPANQEIDDIIGRLA